MALISGVDTVAYRVRDHYKITATTARRTVFENHVKGSTGVPGSAVHFPLPLEITQPGPRLYPMPTSAEKTSDTISYDILSRTAAFHEKCTKQNRPLPGKCPCTSANDTRNSPQSLERLNRGFGIFSTIGCCLEAIRRSRSCCWLGCFKGPWRNPRYSRRRVPRCFRNAADSVG